MAVWKVFVGGAADSHSRIVEDYFIAFAAANPALSCRYFSWEDRGDLARLLNGEAKNGHVSLVGHSYGGDTCFWRMGHVPMVDLLISIDPVAQFKRDWTSIRAGCARWLNVRAEPDKAHRMFDDTIAAIGGKYPRPPAPGTPSAPNYSLVANAHHGDFSGMMSATSNGISGRMLLGGKSVA